jgi:hypothetical protein
MERQQAVLQGLRKYPAQFGVNIEERPRYRAADPKANIETETHAPNATS